MNYLWRIISAVLASELVTSRVRVHVMRWCGCAVSLHSTDIWGGALFGSKNFSIDDGVVMNRAFYFDGSDRLTIGKNVHLGADIRIITGSHEIDANPLHRCGKHFTGPVSIEQGCWVGAGAMILPGVTIAHGCVVAAGSIVTKTTEPNGLYLGSPARRVKELPS